MILRNGVRSTLRARGRTVLFTLLIWLLTVSLALGLGMWAYCAQALAAIDESYTSIALVEYMGDDYPEPDKADDQARQAAQALDGATMADIDGVTLWETSAQTLAALSGYERREGAIPYEDYGVVVVSNLSPMYEDGIQWQPDTFRLPDTVCGVTDIATQATTYYAPGLEPLEVPRYFYDAEEDQYYEYADGQALQVVDPGQFPQVYILDGELVGEMPLAYIPMAGQFYYYDPDTGLYGVEGPVVSAYRGIISSVLYTYEGKEGVLATFEPGDTGFAPESGKRYLVHGAFTDSVSANRTFTVTAFYEGCGTAPYLELSGADDPALTDSLFTDYASYYALANNYVRLEASDHIAALEPFHQGALYLEQGRFPQAGEQGACVVDGRTAAQMDLSLGDTVEVEALTSTPEDRFRLTAGGEKKALEVVGITVPSQDYAGCLWVSGGEGGFASPLFGYQLGRAVLDNALGRQAADALQALAPDGVRVTLYDQGWSTAAQPLQAMEATALAVTAACACGALVVLFLFGYLFVGRQRETVSVLVSLGVPAGKVRLWLLSGAAVVAGIAALAGAIVGALSLGAILRAALASAQGLYAVDQRYSQAAIGVAKAAQGLGRLPRWPAMAAGLAVFLAALALCLFFLRLARRQTAPERGRTRVRVPRGGTSTLGRGALRSALLSMGRGGWRSAVVPAAALVLALLLGLLFSGTQGWSGQIDALYGTAQIGGQVTSTNGRQATSLTVSIPKARLLWQSGMLSRLSVSKGWHYWFYEEMPGFADTSFGQETKAAWIGRQPELVALNSLDAAPAFYYGDPPQVEWLEGWDESFLSGSDYYSVLDCMSYWQGYPISYSGASEWLTYPCLVSQSFLEERSLELGDTFEMQVRMEIKGQDHDLVLSFQTVGAYSGSTSQQEIYVPMSFWCDPSWITGEEAPVADGERITSSSNFSDKAGRDAYFYVNTTLSTCRFTLASPRQLDRFRDYLEDQGISQVGHTGRDRTTVVLQDQAFVETVSALGRYVTFSQILLPALCAAVGLLGFVISWLMVNGRRMEFAIMRGLGASRGRVFLSFFLEQALLALAGCALGGLVLTALGAGGTGWLATAGFLICYLAGCALAVLAVVRTRLIQLLSEKE